MEIIKNFKKYKNIIFDYGGVIAEFNREFIVRCFCDYPEDADTVQKAVFYDWKSLDDGVIEQEEYLQNVYDRLDERLHETAYNILTKWHLCGEINKGTTALIRKLKENGYKLYLLSNAPKHLYDNIGYINEWVLFDGIVVSGAVKHSKPNKDMYEYILEKYSLIP